MGDSTDMELDAHKAVAAVDDAQKAHLKQSTLVPENGIQSLGNSSDLEVVDKLKFFLAIAPSTFSSSSREPDAPFLQGTKTTDIDDDQDRFRRFLLPNGEHISCVYWNGLYHITGTDIIRTLVFRLRAFGRRITNMKKFEEGVFSDLRNLKAGVDATLEVPKSAFLDLLFRNNCIRTQKKQKVFYWYSVSHDKLFLDALERDARREKLGQEPASIAIAEPALSFRYDPTLPLLDQLKSDLGIEKVEETIFSSSAVSHQAYPLLPSSLQDNDHYRQKGEASREHLNFQRSAYSAMHAEGLPSAYTPSYHPSGPQLPSATTLHAQAGTSEAYIDMEGQLFSKPHSTADFFHAASQNNHFPAAQAVSSPISASHKAGAATCQSSPPEQEAHSTMSLRPSEARFICPWYTCGHLFACLPQLLQHIRLHTLVLPLSSQETMLKAVEATSLPSVQPESFARHNAEVSTLLDVLNSSSISSHALNSSGYTSASRSPASTYSPHPASQEATEDIPHQAFMIAPAPSIRRRSS